MTDGQTGIFLMIEPDAPHRIVGALALDQLRKIDARESRRMKPANLSDRQIDRELRRLSFEASAKLMDNG